MSHVPEETHQYLEEVVAHLKTLADGEEQHLLVGNVLEELKGKEALIAADQACSRHVEALLAAGAPAHAADLLASVASSELGLAGVATSPFGSHVVERALKRVDAALDEMDEAEYERARELLTRLNAEVCSQLGEFVTDRFATFAARRLLVVACGREDVLPSTKAQRQGQVAPASKKAGAASAPAGGLAAKVDGGQGGQAGQPTAREPRFPDMVSAAVAVMTREDYVGDNIAEIVYSTYGSPYAQGLLRACSYDRRLVTSLVPIVLGASYLNDSAKGGRVLEGVSSDTFDTLVRDTTGSHVVEAVAEVCPPPLLEELHTRFFAGNVAKLAQHPAANFALQALLAAASSKDMVASMYAELAPVLAELLRRQRGGVVAALVAAAGRTGCVQRELCGTLAAALQAHAPWAGRPAELALAPALLSMDSDFVFGAAAAPPPGGRRPRLSTLGASILINVLSYGQGACRDFTDSVAALRGDDAVAVGCDPSGSRVLEALLEGSAPPKVKARLAAGLAGSYARVSSTGAGSFLMERLYERSDIHTKEAVARELSGAAQALQGMHWGPSLLRRVGADAYARDPTAWRRHVDASSKAVNEFASLFGETAGAGASAGGGAGMGAGVGAHARAGEGDRSKAPVAGKPAKREHGEGGTGADEDVPARGRAGKRARGVASDKACERAGAVGGGAAAAASGNGSGEEDRMARDKKKSKKKDKA